MHRIRQFMIALTLPFCGSCVPWSSVASDAPPARPQFAGVVPAQELALSPWARENLALAGAALKQLEDHAAHGESLAPADQIWLTGLQTKIGRDTLTAPDPQAPSREASFDCRLTVEQLNANPEERLILASSLRVAIAASLEHPATFNLGAVSLAVHNRTVAGLLRTAYTVQNFKDLLAILEKNGVFEEQVDEETGLIQTAGLAEGENPAMGRQWVTDTVRCGDLQRQAHPLTWPLALMTLARFYEQPAQLKAFHEIIQDPSRYLHGDVKSGVAHIFDPKKLTRDPAWFNNKRLESHGLALKAFCDTLVDGFVRGMPWGFGVAIFDNPEQLKTLSEAIANLSVYLVAIRYWEAPSAGPWEETPFAGGLTWDTEAARAGLASLADLLENPAYQSNPSIVKMRAALRRTTNARRLSGPVLAQAIAQGRKKILERLVYAREPMEHPLRPLDAATVFVAGSTLKMARDLNKDVSRHLKVLDYVQKGLVRDHGMLRYAPFNVTLGDGSVRSSPDSYLAKNYWIAFDKENKLDLPWRRLMSAFGSRDASDVDIFLARALFATPLSEAQWFLVSDVAYGYAYQASRILDVLHNERRNATNTEHELIQRAMGEAAVFVNRSLARLTDRRDELYPSVKSNGRYAPAFAVPEAYEFVSTLDPAVAGRVLAGAHTPLAWARASLYRALMQYYANLERMNPSIPGPKGGASYAHRL